MTVGIYGIFDSETDECLYVGQSAYIEDRWKRHLNDLRNGNHSRKEFITWFKNHGENVESLNFKILEKCNNTDEAKNSTEMKWFEALTPKFYGFEPGMNFKWSHSAETIEKLRNSARRGRTMHNFTCKSCSKDFTSRRLKMLYCSRECFKQVRCIEVNEDLRIRMKNLYEVERMTMKAMSVELGISDAMVHKLMVILDIPRRSRGSK